MNDLDERIEYEGRADFIDNDDLLKWTVENKHFENIQQRLKDRTSVLIAGPRGSGKTHQMKLLYNQCINSPDYPMAVYVTYGKYYHLEPFLYKESNAINIFHTWVLGKILVACHQLPSRSGVDETTGEELEGFGSFNDLNEFVSQLEKGLREDRHEEWISKITINSVVRFLEDTAIKLKKKRIILLLDDAALTLTPEYMKEFFDVFRGLRTQKIAPKASVYPGTTEYGPAFHLGHDAEKVDIWFNVEEPDYNDFMDKLVNKRLPDEVKQIAPEILDIFKFASFGIPRAFLYLVKSYLEKDRKGQARFNKVIDEQADLIEAEYLSLRKKMTQYKTIIKIGYELFRKILEDITKENNDLLDKKEKDEKQLTIGISEDGKLKFSRMLKFLTEAGLLYELKSVKHGESREYKRYIPHLLFLIKNRAFSVGKGFDAKKVLEFIKRKSVKHPVRRSFDTLLPKRAIEQLKLDLPPCPKCGAERLTEGQKFCHNCGAELVEKSKFESCMDIPINELPITKRQKEKIGSETLIKTVGDIFTSESPASALQEASQIGPKRSQIILNIVTKTVEEFLA